MAKGTVAKNSAVKAEKTNQVKEAEPKTNEKASDVLQAAKNAAQDVKTAVKESASFIVLLKIFFGVSPPAINALTLILIPSFSSIALIHCAMLPEEASSAPTAISESAGLIASLERFQIYS